MRNVRCTKLSIHQRVVRDAQRYKQVSYKLRRFFQGNNVIPCSDSHAEVIPEVINNIGSIIILQLIIGRGQW